MSQLIWPCVENLSISDHQKRELKKATSTRIGILAGSAGCGKTFVVSHLIKELIGNGIGADRIATAGPTGKSAVRITEFMQLQGLNLRAKTIHSLLRVQDCENGGFGFFHNESNPLEYSVIIVDEVSMVDESLMCSLFSARPRGCHFLFVGDPSQLSPVGAGAPFRDLIHSNLVGYGELTEIRRSVSDIADICMAIRNGKPWSESNSVHVLQPSGTGKTYAENQLRSVEKILDQCRQDGLDPIWDVQIIVAVNSKSPLSRHNVNARFQAYLNDEPKVAGCAFRKGDKIVCLKNGFISLLDPKNTYGIDESLLDNGQVYVANGQLAKVIEIEPKSTIAQLEKSDIEIRILRGKQEESEDGDEGSGCAFDLAYGLSCHKYQGSEQSVVIVLIDEYPGAKMVCSREWLYTAISRAKQDCWLIGNKATMDGFCRRLLLPSRKTFLREQIGLVQAEKLLLELV